MIPIILLLLSNTLTNHTTVLIICYNKQKFFQESIYIFGWQTLLITPFTMNTKKRLYHINRKRKILCKKSNQTSIQQM